MIPLLLALALDCAPCHKDIAASFARSPMANTSGPVTRLDPATYLHAPSSTRYEISPTGLVSIATPEATATQQLHYFIGSGAHGRSFLFRRNNRLYEAPITLYAHKGWAASPGYEHDRNSDWTRRITRDCLWCHTSGESPGGLTCQRCHAPDAKHFSRPSLLPARERNDVCRQCHSLGDRRDLPGKSFFDYKPGMLLDTLVRYGAKPAERDAPLSTTGHFERLEASACSKASGGRLWCGTCHDPHPVSGTVRDRNQPCRSCHPADKCVRGPDCVSCHMPRNPAPDSGHAIFTDHWIR